MMKRPVALTLITVFLLWILPLGVFVAPSKEKLFCDGQRAICMCHLIKHKPSGPGQSLAKTDQKEETSGFSSSQYDVADVVILHDIQDLRYYSNRQAFCSLFVPRPAEHVPKV